MTYYRGGGKKTRRVVAYHVGGNPTPILDGTNYLAFFTGPDERQHGDRITLFTLLTQKWAFTLSESCSHRRNVSAVRDHNYFALAQDPTTTLGQMFSRFDNSQSNERERKGEGTKIAPIGRGVTQAV